MDSERTLTDPGGQGKDAFLPAPDRAYRGMFAPGRQGAVKLCVSVHHGAAEGTASERSPADAEDARYAILMMDVLRLKAAQVLIF